MRRCLDREKEYGLVLEGGGARGAYQIGVWRALREAGIKIRGVAGTSVGALNGAMICMNDLKGAEEIWREIRYSRILEADDRLMAKLSRRKRGRSVRFTPRELLLLLRLGYQATLGGGFGIGPLRELIAEHVDEEAIRKSPMDFYAVTYCVSDKRKLVLDMKNLPPGRVGDMLMASSYLKSFRRQRLAGKYYLDGCVVDNVPVGVLIEKGYRDIIVIRIGGVGVDTERHLKVPEGVHLYHIAPRCELGGILEFDPGLARRNMRLGYRDGRRALGETR